MVNKEAFHHEYNLNLTDKIEGTYDVVLLAVQHEVFAQYDENLFMIVSMIKGLINSIGD